jgi:hypothetical protein
MVTTKTLPDIFYTVGTTLSEPVFIQDNVDNTCVPEWQYSLRPQSGSYLHLCRLMPSDDRSTFIP